MPSHISRRARAGMILVPAACVVLTVVAGCGGAASSVTDPALGSSTAIPAAPSSSQLAPPASTSATPSDDGSAGGSAVVNMKDGQGDSYTQTFTFGSPESESDVPDAIDGMQTCQLGVAIPARNLVIPVQITTTLTTSVQTQIPIEINVTDYAQAGYSTAGPNAGIPGDVVYQTTSGDQCETDQEGAQALPLTSGTFADGCPIRG